MKLLKKIFDSYGVIYSTNRPIAFHKAIKEYLEINGQKWISVNEKLPDLNIEVFVCHDNEPFTHSVAALEEHQGLLKWNNRDKHSDLYNYNLWMQIPPK